MFLSRNQIDAPGSKFLAYALRINQDGPTATVIAYYNMHRLFQTLTTLHLGSNRIGDEGAKCLAEALTINQVRWALCKQRRDAIFSIALL